MGYIMFLMHDPPNWTHLGMVNGLRFVRIVQTNYGLIFIYGLLINLHLLIDLVR